MLIVATCRGDEAEVVAATVNGEPVFAAEIERELARVIRGRPIKAGARRVMQAKTLAQLIDRHLIIQWLKKSNRAASEADIDLAVTRLTKRLQQRELTLKQHLDKQGLTERELRRLFEWQVSWQRFLDRYLTDKNLEKFYNDHRRDFDGTKLHVAHILLKVDADERQSVDAAVEFASQLMQQIRSGKLTFAAAAQQHSAAPTAKKGGDIGLISRHEPMPESFSHAAFALKEGRVSEPVITAFGVHLIRCLAIEAGQKPWQEVREELTGGVTGYLFTWAAGKERAEAKVEFTAATPYFQPGTEVLAD